MKIALLMVGNEGDQIVLEPEGVFERALLDVLRQRLQEHREFKIFTGNFAETRGGYYRQFSGENALMIRFRQPPDGEPAE